MTKTPRYLLVLVAGIVMLAMTLSAVGPVQAQDGTTNQQTYVTQEGDTLGDVLDQAGIDVSMEGDAEVEANLREFFTLNPDLQFAADADVTVPEGIEVVGEEPAAGETFTFGDWGDTYGLDADADLREFVLANRDLALVAGQTVQLPAAAQEGEAGEAAGGEAGQAGGQTEQGDADTYTVVAGESLSDIADRLGITVEQLVELNPDLVPAGTVINVPAGQGEVPQTGTDQPQAGQEGIPQTGGLLSPWGGEPDVPGLNLELGRSDVPAGMGLYIVQGGDTLSNIAQRFDIDIVDLWRMNPTIENPNVIYRGQRLVVPGGESVDPRLLATEDQIQAQEQQFSENPNTQNQGE